ncbi:MAG: hypothetical protein ACKVY0_28775 [Prosthecobacter sp.]|uniref:hypothetical protein n=1 Tax=Prosthecobacter sp. TaxID=1965333 RepID=UPI0039006312
MKALTFIAALAAVAFTGWWLASPKNRPDSPNEAYPTQTSQPPPTSTLTDATEVFQKAFWKRPTDQDRILHAERREWADAQGLKKWQWFIEVEPSPDLVRHLITDNAFSLSQARGGWRKPAAGLPAWFAQPSTSQQVLANSSGSFTLIYDKEANRIRATDSGGGFRPGAPEQPAQASTASVAPGRLPLTSPPNPPKP